MSEKKNDRDMEIARQLLEKIDKGLGREPSIFDWLLSQKRMSGIVILGIFISGLAIALPTYQILMGYFPAPQAHLHFPIHVNMLLILIFLLWPLGRKSWREPFNLFTIIDIILILLVIIVQVWISYDIEEFVFKTGNLTTLDITISTVYLGVVLEATRRTVGIALPIVVVFFLFHTLYSNLFPGVLYGPPTSLEWLAELEVIRISGVFGIPVMAMSYYVALFIIFAVLLINSGSAKFFIKMALALTGKQIGGPAKASVVSSAMMGTVSGSVIGNVVGTGSFTIPLMKQTGYEPHFAAGVEACSSSGGMIMPPIMGVTAFVMAEYMGVPYLKVAYAAAIPACLYFLSVFIQVHFEGLRRGLRPLPKELMPNFWQTLKGGWQLLIPLVVIVGFLVLGFTIIRAAFWGVVSIYFCTLLKKETRMGPIRLFSALEIAAKTIAPVTAACASAGIIIGCLFSSGLGMRFSVLITELAGDQLWLGLVLTMIVSIILGMGLTVTPVYITLAAMVIPGLINSMNVYPMAAHMFCMYYGVKSNLTPPVAIASYAAAGIAGAKPMRTANTGFRIGIAGFIVPFMFVYRPELLLHGTPVAIIWVVITSMLGIACVALAAEGWILTKANPLERVLLLIGAIAFITADPLTVLGGLTIMAIVIVTQKLRVRRQRERFTKEGKV
jgi:TRAP transporter 4TM/12TM fusion protein